MKKRLSVILLLMVCLITFLSIGCNGGTQTQYSIVLNANKLNIERFSVYQMTATLKKGDETITDETLVWTSNDTSVATVTENGLITGVNEGETTVICAFGDVTASCKVLVGNYEIKLEMSNKNLEIVFEENYSFELYVTATKNDEIINVDVVWTSSDDNVASVSDGMVTVLSEGECYITATACDTNGFYVSARCRLVIGSEKSIAEQNDVTAPDKDWGN